MECESFALSVKGRQGCGMYPFLFNVYMDCMIYEICKIQTEGSELIINGKFGKC